MKKINAYFTEKLKINKHTIEKTPQSDSFSKFLVLYKWYNKQDDIKFEVFDSYDEAKDFFTNQDVYFLDGYCLTSSQWTVLEDMIDGHIYDDYAKELKKYVKDNNVLPILKYYTMKNLDTYLTEKLKINKKSISGFERSEKKKPKDGDKFFAFYASKTDKSPIFVVNKSILKDFHIEGGDTVSFKYSPFGKEVTELKNVYVNSNGYYEESINNPKYKYAAVLLPLDIAEETVKNMKNDLLMTAKSIFDEKHTWMFTDDLYLPPGTELEKILKAIQDAR